MSSCSVIRPTLIYNLIFCLDDEYVLHAPFTANTTHNPSLQQKIAHYLAMVLGKCESEVKKCIGIPSLFAGKLRIQGRGDLFQTRTVTRKPGTPVERRNCYVKVCM